MAAGTRVAEKNPARSALKHPPVGPAKQSLHGVEKGGTGSEHEGQEKARLQKRGRDYFW